MTVPVFVEDNDVAPTHKDKRQRGWKQLLSKEKCEADGDTGQGVTGSVPNRCTWRQVKLQT